MPKRLPGLPVEITHDQLFPGAVAGHHVAVGVQEKGVEAHVALQQPFAAVDIVDEAVVEIGPEPLLGAPGFQQFIDKPLKIRRHHGPVVDFVLRLDEIKAVMHRCRGKFHAQLVGQPVQRHQLRRVPVLHRHAEAHVPQAHFLQPFQGFQAPVVAVRQAPNLVVGLFQPLDGDPDADVRERPAQVHDPVGEIAVGGNHDPVTFLPQLPDDLLQVLPQKGLAAGDVGEIHPGQLFYGLHRDLLFGPGRRLIAAAHAAPGVAAVGHDDGAVEFLHRLSLPCR